MAIIIPDKGEELILNFILGKKSVPATQTLRLFKNDYVPVESTNLVDFVEATENGYAPITLNSSNWTVMTNSGVTSANHTEQVFTFSEAVSVYGYYITVVADGNNQVLWAEKFTNAPFVLPANGGSIAITLRIAAD